jgi:hypothetical protein
MIPVPVDEKNEYYLNWLFSPLVDRTFFVIDPDVYRNKRTIYVSLDDKLHGWFKETNIKYDIYLKPHSEYYTRYNDWYYLVFEKESDAVLFKLTWC